MAGEEIRLKKADVNNHGAGVSAFCSADMSQGGQRAGQLKNKLTCLNKPRWLKLELSRWNVAQLDHIACIQHNLQCRLE